MRMRAAAIAILCAGLCATAAAADTALSVTIDGRPISRSAGAALVRQNVAYVSVNEIVRTFNGLVTSRGDASAVSIGSRSVLFTPGSASATVDSDVEGMGVPTFLAHGVLYVPLQFFIDRVVSGATVQIDLPAGHAGIHVVATPVPTVAPSPAATASAPGRK